MISFVSIKVLISLMDGKLHTATSLASENEVSTKTISRAINTLLEAGVGIESKLGKFGGYYLSPSFIPQIYCVDNKDLSRMLSVAMQTKDILPTTNSTIEENIINTTPKSKLKDVISMSSKIILDSKPWINASTDNNKFDIIYNSCISNTKIEFDYINYKGSISHRTFCPYCVTLKNGTWYTYGMCKTSNKLKLFKLSRMSNIKNTNQKFTPSDINIFDKPWNKFDNFSQTEIMVKIKNQSLEDISEWLNFKITNRLENETIATALITENDGIFNKLIEECDKIKILSPAHIVSTILHKCNTIQEIYS